MKRNLKDLSQLLRQLRTKSGYSQAQIAKVLGITRSAYTYYEIGTTSLNLETVRKLAELYSVPVEAFLYPERFINKDNSEG